MLTENTKGLIKTRKASAVQDNVVFHLAFTWSAGDSVYPQLATGDRENAELRGAAWVAVVMSLM